MEFGVPSKKRVAQEKYPETPVITLLPFEGENTSRKMEFNNKAYEILGLNQGDYNHVAFSFDKSDFTNNMIVNANEFKIDAALRISKNGKLSNKSHYEEIKNRYNVDMEKELELVLIQSDQQYSGHPIFKLVTLKSYQMSLETETEQQDQVITDEVQDTVLDEEKEQVTDPQPVEQEDPLDELVQEDPQETQENEEEDWLP